jgi:tRNA modification GTPase
MSMTDTIYAQSTAAVKSGVAIFRLSGPDVEAVANSILNKKLSPRQFELVEVKWPGSGEIIDVCLAVRFSGPSSFTGEDVLELHTHGGVATCREILNLLSDIPGLRLADPGEFTRRAFESGKLNLTSAEALADLIDADTQHQRRVAMNKMLGGFFDFFECWRREVVEIRSLLEASLDFSDEGDLSTDLEQGVSEKLQMLSKSVSEAIHRTKRHQSIKDGFQVLVAGPPNAGKSSLVNALAKRKIAIVSDMPGTTRDLIEVKLEIEGYPVIVIDSAGLRTSQDEIETIGIELARDRASNVDLVLWLGDFGSAFQELGPLDAELLCVAAKCDLKPLNDQLLNISVVSGHGIDELVGALAEKAKAKFGGAEASGVLFARQLQSAHAFQSNITVAINSLSSGFSEICAVELENCSAHLAAVVNDTSNEDVLDEIFSRFCLGK